MFTYANVGHLKVQTVLHGSRQCSGRCYCSLLQMGVYIFFQCIAVNIRFLLLCLKRELQSFSSVGCR